MSDFKPYGPEWAAGAVKLPKETLVKIIRELSTGTDDEKLCSVGTSAEFYNAVEGIVNDLALGVSDTDETMKAMKEVVHRMIYVFRENASKKYGPMPEALAALDDYLSAGCKETRHLASIKAKKVWETVYGEPYINQSERPIHNS